MLKNIYVACNTLREEIEFVLKDLMANYPILWVDSGLHNFPERLHKAIQDQIKTIVNAQNIVLLFGNCGNSVLGLSSPTARIIIPRVYDCISLFLGGDKPRIMLENEAPSYYLTKGYLKNESNIWSEYTYCLNKYGPEKAKKVIQIMLNNYKRLIVIDTGAYEPEEIFEVTNKIAEEFGLAHNVTVGSLRIIYKAFREEWDEDFVIIEPGESIRYGGFGFG
ncbi:MAG: DUF1638 domain-containing protein [Thermincola sp.]|jgi:hypothetical protein|nr:DUF1638 domain-containing protein [Thermincola sp.]MDT3701515.1 DUF1638 domain-containing protein [Thermincola sp.]